MRKGKTVILFFGSFNPIHIGHTALAQYSIDFVEADELWFIPTPQNPHKDKKSLLDFDQRCEIIKKSICFEPKFKLCTIEKHLPQQWYTYRSLRALSAIYEENTFYFLMGADSFYSLESWYRGQDILSHSKILVYPRNGVDIKDCKDYCNVKIMRDAPIINISSTMIRQRIEENKTIRYFLPNPQLLDSLNLD